MTERHRVLRLVIVLGLLALAASCGLTANDEPQAIPVDNLPPDLLDPDLTTSTTAGGVPITVYLLRQVDDTTVVVAPVERTVTDPLSPGQRIEALVSAQPTDEELGLDLFSSIPSGVRLLGRDLDQATGELVINVSQELFDVQLSELTNAFAQMVWTASELDGVRSVRFQVDGEDRNARDAEGGEQSSVDINDYRSMAPR